MATFTVIVPAAGKGRRFDSNENKALAKIDGRPMVLRTLERFITRKDVAQTILVVAPEDVEAIKSKFGANLAFMGVKFVIGGARRCDSVAAALREVAASSEYVAIHDAARPCVTDDQIQAVFDEAVKAGAAILANPITGTIKQVAGSGAVEKTVSREGWFEAQTPQVFHKSILMGAYNQLAEIKDEVTDDSQLVERIGHPVSVVRGDATNIKVTTRGDLVLAAAILKSRPVRQAPRMGAFEEAQW